MIIHVAIVKHNFGDNVYVARSDKGIMSRLFGYVEENWTSTHGPEIPQDKEQAVFEYFRKDPDETYDLFEAELEDD